MDNPILQIKNIEKRFGKVIAVKNAFLELNHGEIVAMLGESGCGKTTLLRLIAGFIWPDKGEIYLRNQKIASASGGIPPEKREIGMLFQDFSLFPHLNVEKNIRFGISNKPLEEQRKQVKELLEIIGLEGVEKRYPHELSGGQQQRVALARALARRPSLLLLDEPFSNLDETIKVQMRKDLSVILHQLNTAALLVTHDVRDALEVADRIAVMSHGEILQTGTSKELYSSPSHLHTAKIFGRINKLSARKIDPHRNGFVFFRPGAISISTPPTSLKGIVIRCIFSAPNYELMVSCEDEIVILKSQLAVAPGNEVYLAIDQTQLLQIQ